MEFLVIVITIFWVIIVGSILNYIVIDSFKGSIVCFILDLVMMFILKWTFGFVSSFVCLIEEIYDFLVLIFPKLPWDFPGLPTSQYIIWFVIWVIIFLISLGRSNMRKDIFKKYNILERTKELDEILNKNIGIYQKNSHALNYTYLIIQGKKLIYYSFKMENEKLVDEEYDLKNTKELIIKENIITEDDKATTMYNVSVSLENGKEIYVGLFSQNMYSKLVEIKNAINIGSKGVSE